jgi:chromosome segregation ATPase
MLEENTMATEETDLNSAEFERRFFAGAEIVTLQIPILKETQADIQATIERNSWESEEGLRILLTLGLGYAQGRRLLQADDEERARLAGRLADLESLAAVMKFRTFSFMRDNQVLETRMGALQNAKTGLEAVVQRLRPERDALHEEVERLQAEAEALRNRLAAMEAEQPETLSWAGRLTGYIKNLLKFLRRQDHVNNDQSSSGA